MNEAQRKKLVKIFEDILDKYGGQDTLKVLGQTLQMIGGGNAYPVGKVIEELAEIDW